MTPAAKAVSATRPAKTVTGVELEQRVLSAYERLKLLTWECVHRQAVLSFLILAFLAMVAVPAATFAVMLLVGKTANWIAAPICLAAALVGLWWAYLRPLGRAHQIFTLAIFLCTVLASVCLAAYFFDSTWDGMSYHTEAILGLLHGANPVSQTLGGQFGLWTNHYPKAMWYFAAATAGCLHLFETGKVYNYFLMFAAGVYAWRAFRSMGLTPRVAASLALLAAANPVAVSQMHSFYVDGAMASLLTLLILSSLTLLGRPALLDRMVFATAAILCVATKFTGVAYVAIVAALLAGAVVFLPGRELKDRRLRAVGSLLMEMTIVSVVGVVILGFNPYVTNVRQGHHPMYPLAGADKVDAISGESPNLFLAPGRNRFQNFGVSLFGESSDVRFAGMPKLKVPFTVRAAEVRSFINADNRIAGWGVFLSGVSLASMLLYLYVRGWQIFPRLGFAFLLIAATTFANPYAWWARFAPQVALLPILLLAPALAIGSRKVKWVSAGLCLLLFCDAMICAAGSSYGSFAYTRALKKEMAQIAQECGPGEYSIFGEPLLHFEQLPAYRGVTIHAEPETPANTPSAYSIPFGTRYRVTLHRGACSVPQTQTAGQ